LPDVDVQPTFIRFRVRVVGVVRVEVRVGVEVRGRG
jgi:hypothetical protein